MIGVLTNTLRRNALRKSPANALRKIGSSLSLAVKKVITAAGADQARERTLYSTMFQFYVGVDAYLCIHVMEYSTNRRVSQLAYLSSSMDNMVRNTHKIRWT